MARPIKNNALFFSHDSDMRNDIKIRALRIKFTNEGYSVYCMLLEILTDSDNFQLEMSDINRELISADIAISQKRFDEILDFMIHLNLLQLKNNFLSCKTLTKRFEPLLFKRKYDRLNIHKHAETEYDNGVIEYDNEVIEYDNDIVTTDNRSIVEYSIVENNIEEKNIEENKKENNNKESFELARKLYPGTKRGLDTEYANYKKKNKDFKSVIDLLHPAIEKQIEYKKKLIDDGKFCPEWKNFTTWINNRCWEDELPKYETQKESDKRMWEELRKKIEENDKTEVLTKGKK